MWRRKWRRRYPTRRRYGRRRGWRRRRWRRGHFRRKVRNFVVREHVPSRRRTVWVSGWEPLGQVCDTTTAIQEATPYNFLEGASGGHFYGSWGKHYFTIGNLLLRALARWNYWSDDWSSFDYVSFKGATIYITPPQDQAWMITFDPYFQYKKSPLGSNKDKEDLWVHPGILLHTPHTHLIFPAGYFKRQKLYKVRVKPPPGWKGFVRFPEAFDYILLNWVWTWWNPFKCFMDAADSTATCVANPWWAKLSKPDEWVNRSKYNTPGSAGNKTWGPFLPSKLGTSGIPFSAWFQYRIKFQLAGDSIWRPLPRNFINDGMVPDPPGPNGAETDEARKKRKRPLSEADIWPEDLDSCGILKRRAYKRITGPDKRDLARGIQQQQRAEYISSKLNRIVSKFIN